MPNDLVGWVVATPIDAAGDKRQRDTNTQTEVVRYGKVLTHDTSACVTRVLPQYINHRGRAVTITPNDAPITPMGMQDVIDGLWVEKPLTELRPVLSNKGRVWGLAECTDLHPLETKLAAIPGVAPAVPISPAAQATSPSSTRSNGSSP